jgi:hypothetical protein
VQLAFSKDWLDRAHAAALASDRVGFANSGGLVFVDESAEHIALA